MNLNILVCLQVYKAVQSGDYNTLCWCSFKKLSLPNFQQCVYSNHFRPKEQLYFIF